MDQVHYASEKMDWETPDELFSRLDDEFQFALDVCATFKNTKLTHFISPEQDSLKTDWAEYLEIIGKPTGTCWMNPPYGRDPRTELPAFIRKAWAEKQKGVPVVCLVPSRTDTRWWGIFYDHKNFRTRDPRDEVRLLPGRIQFEGAAHKAPFPSAIIVLQPYLQLRPDDVELA